MSGGKAHFVYLKLDPGRKTTLEGIRGFMNREIPVFLRAGNVFVKTKTEPEQEDRILLSQLDKNYNAEATMVREAGVAHVGFWLKIGGPQVEGKEVLLGLEISKSYHEFVATSLSPANKIRLNFFLDCGNFEKTLETQERRKLANQFSSYKARTLNFDFRDLVLVKEDRDGKKLWERRLVLTTNNTLRWLSDDQEDRLDWMERDAKVSARRLREEKRISDRRVQNLSNTNMYVTAASSTQIDEGLKAADFEQQRKASRTSNVLRNRIRPVKGEPGLSETSMTVMRDEDFYETAAGASGALQDTTFEPSRAGEHSTPLTIGERVSRQAAIEKKDKERKRREEEDDDKEDTTLTPKRKTRLEIFSEFQQRIEKEKKMQEEKQAEDARKKGVEETQKEVFDLRENKAPEDPAEYMRKALERVQERVSMGDIDHVEDHIKYRALTVLMILKIFEESVEDMEKNIVAVLQGREYVGVGGADLGRLPTRRLVRAIRLYYDHQILGEELQEEIVRAVEEDHTDQEQEDGLELEDVAAQFGERLRLLKQARKLRGPFGMRGGPGVGYLHATAGYGSAWTQESERWEATMAEISRRVGGEPGAVRGELTAEQAEREEERRIKLEGEKEEDYESVDSAESEEGHEHETGSEDDEEGIQRAGSPPPARPLGPPKRHLSDDEYQE